MEQSQEDRFLTLQLSTVSVQTISLQQTSEVKMLAVCQLHHTYYFLLHHISHKAFGLQTFLYI